MMKVHQQGKENANIHQGLDKTELRISQSISVDDFVDLTNETKGNNSPIEVIIENSSVASANPNTNHKLTSFWVIHAEQLAEL